MNQNICSAIRDKKIIAFYYDGGLRNIEPYCYGVTKNGSEILRAFQISGFSRSRNPKGWKLFSLSKISNLKILDEKLSVKHYLLDPNGPKINPYDEALKVAK